MLLEYADKHKKDKMREMYVYNTKNEGLLIEAISGAKMIFYLAPELFFCLKSDKAHGIVIYLIVPKTN